MTPIKDFAVSEQMNKLLIELNACEDARTWAADKSWKEIFDTCHRGDWLLWLFKKVNPNDLQKLTLAKGHCANTVRHLMKDERSTKAVDAAIAFGEGLITREELKAAYAAAAAVDAYDAAAAAAVDAYAAAAAAYAAARTKNQQATADICRKYLPIEIWNIQSK
jgi:hypothetical protein